MLAMRDSARHCACGKASGRYLDERRAQYSGTAVPIGIDNRTLLSALSHRHLESARGYRFEAFVIPPNSFTTKRVQP